MEFGRELPMTVPIYKWPFFCVFKGKNFGVAGA